MKKKQKKNIYSISVEALCFYNAELKNYTNLVTLGSVV